MVRNTLQDAKEVNNYKARELKEKVAELEKVGAALALSKQEIERKQKELDDKESLLKSTLESLAKSDQDSAEKAAVLAEKTAELLALGQKLERAAIDITARDAELAAKEASIGELKQEIEGARREITLKTSLLLAKTEELERVVQKLEETNRELARVVEDLQLKGHEFELKVEELNVKEVHFAARADAFVTYKLKPNFAVLGKKLGPKMKSAQAAIGAADAGVLKAALDRDGRAEVIVDGDPLVLTADELQIQVEAKPGFAAASAPVGVVVLDTQLTPDLIAEGWYREVLSRVQATRKDLELDYQARIQIGLAGDAEVLEACRAREAQLKQETLARELVFGDASSGEARELKLEGRTVIVSVAPLSARPASTSGR